MRNDRDFRTGRHAAVVVLPPHTSCWPRSLAQHCLRAHVGANERVTAVRWQVVCVVHLSGWHALSCAQQTMDVATSGHCTSGEPPHRRRHARSAEAPFRRSWSRCARWDIALPRSEATDSNPLRVCLSGPRSAFSVFLRTLSHVWSRPGE